MPQPNGYRKALRFMRHADHFGFPIVTFVDTPGAFAGKAAEEQGQVRPKLHMKMQQHNINHAFSAHCMLCCVIMHLYIAA